MSRSSDTATLWVRLRNTLSKDVNFVNRKAGIRPVDNIGFSFTRRKFNSCLFLQTITTHQIKHNEMLAIYTKLKTTK
jgi:hypothetical protein